MRILTVLRSGGEYKAEHVERLERQCARFAPGIPFHCISDVDVPGRLKMKHDWPGWWAKMEVFRFRGPCLYLDLDTTLTGFMGRFVTTAYNEPFAVLRDFNYPVREVQSSVMAWRGDMRRLYSAFAADPAKHMQDNNCARWWGDQGFIEKRAKRAYWQDLLPGACVSYKKHCKNGVPHGARVVVFHGRPRPWETDLDDVSV